MDYVASSILVQGPEGEVKRLLDQFWDEDNGYNPYNLVPIPEQDFGNTDVRELTENIWGTSIIYHEDTSISAMYLNKKGTCIISLRSAYTPPVQLVSTISRQYPSLNISMSVDFITGDNESVLGYTFNDGLYNTIIDDREDVPKYDTVYDLVNDLAVVVKGDKWGFIDEEDNIVIPLEYDTVWEFNVHDVAAVMKGGKCGLIDKSNKIIIPFEYDYLQPLSKCGVVRVQNDGQWSLLEYSNGILRNIPYT